jgi:methylglutamate dehydrogenase subunit B
MLIPCPYCGARDSHEFTYRGSAAGTRPDPAQAEAVNAFHDYVYLRENPAGDNIEWWYHGAGCRSWLKVLRDTNSHEIKSVVGGEVKS